MYRQFIIIITAVLFFTGCSDKKEAEKMLREATTMYEHQQFLSAKNKIDSLNLLYPNEVEIRREALTLMRLVERGECTQNIAYCDSMIPVRTKELEDLKKGFVFEKDSAYNELGSYIWRTMTIERNVQRSYIRCGVNEKGEMYMASVYFGSRPINHTGLKFSISNENFAETPSIPYDGGVNYRFKDLGNTTEVVTYKGEHCKAIANFAYTAAKERIKAEYTGGRKFALYLSENDKKGIRATYDLALVLSEINAMQKEKNRSEKKILLIEEKLKKSKKSFL